MTIEEPAYHVHLASNKLKLVGQEAVKSLYRMWAETTQCIFYAENEQVAVADNYIASTAKLYQQVSGAALKFNKAMSYLPGFLAENDLRMMKVKTKNLRRLPHPQGAADFARLRSVISSARKQGVNITKADPRPRATRRRLEPLTAFASPPNSNRQKSLGTPNRSTARRRLGSYKVAENGKMAPKPLISAARKHSRTGPSPCLEAGAGRLSAPSGPIG